MITIVKVGGSILDSKERMDVFLDAFLKIEGHKVLVHGGGKSATILSEKLDIKSEFVNGRRKTSLEMMDVILMCFASINKNLVSEIQKRGNLALGLSGADFGSIPSVRRNSTPIDFGYVGDPILDEVKPELILYCFSQNAIPVFSALSWEKVSGRILNSNADAVAFSVANSLKEMDAITLLYAFDFPGVLKSAGNNQIKLDKLSKATYKEMLDSGDINGGMIPKLDCGFLAFNSGIEHVEIVNYSTLCEGTKLVVE
jgi:acetylglutamate kinase